MEVRFRSHQLAEVLVRIVARNREYAWSRSVSAVRAGRLESLVWPILARMIQCRDEIGVACLGTSPNNPILWKRYAGPGAGVCVELDVPDK